MDFKFGPDLDTKKLAEYAELLETAYTNGAERGGHMEWNDVQAALEKGIEAIGAEADKFMDAANEGLLGADTAIFFADGTEQSPEFISASTLLMAYRYPEGVAWADVDHARDILLDAPKPGL